MAAFVDVQKIKNKCISMTQGYLKRLHSNLVCKLLKLPCFMKATLSFVQVHENPVIDISQ